MQKIHKYFILYKYAANEMIKPRYLYFIKVQNLWNLIIYRVQSICSLF